MLKSVCFKLNSSHTMDSSFVNGKSASVIEAFIPASEYSRPGCDCGQTNRGSNFCSCAVLVKTIIALILITSLSLNVVLLISKTVAGYNSDCYNGTAELSGVKEVCLDCRYFEDFISFEGLREMLTYRRRKGKEKDDICCFDYSDSLHEKSKIFLLQQITSNTFLSNGTSTRPAAHLTLDPVAISDRGTRLRWNTGGDKEGSAFMKHVQYANDTVLIQVEGAYYVYSFITFMSSKGKHDTFLNHYVYRISAHQGQTTKDGINMIFMDKQMRLSGTLEYQTSLLVGIVNLKSGDRIFTAVSNSKAVYRSSLTNYMGLFKL